MSDQADRGVRERAGDRCRLTRAARCRLAKTGGGEEGTSLIELLVVLAILALAVAIALPRADVSGRGPSLRLLASDIAAKLRSARSIALAENRDVSFTLDTEARTYGVAGTGAPQTLPAAVDLSVTTARQAVVRESKEAHLVFFSDGTSSGGTIRLSDRHQSIAIGVEWLTGAVHIERGAP